VTNPAEPENGQPSPQDGNSTPEPSTNPPAPASVNPDGTPTAAADEGLPDWEPLTPELVEDEAIRGDFVIRWTVVGLALLLGISPISDTRTLVHLKTGQFMASHGFLPPARDVFSYTATDRHWVNLSWMFDLLASGVHAVSGGIGLSILQGLVAGVAFGLLAHTYRPDIRTWWGSICAALALLVCYPQFTTQPELITLLGMSLLLWLIVRSETATSPKLLWSCVGVIWVWSQFDSRAFLGWQLLLVMAIGEYFRRGDDAPQQRALWGQVALAGVAVTLLHPFLWESWLASVRLYATEYPALQQIFSRPGRVELGFHPIWHEQFWMSINHNSIAALVLFAATVTSLVLNRERLHPGHLLAVILFNMLACLATHELAVASLVNCVVCTVNAQTWHRTRFGQVYSIAWKELLFSRGGRAVTVVGFFAVAWLALSGRIEGPSGRRTGLGFDESLLVQMDSYQRVAANSFDDHPFHFVARQGDLLIWAGQKSFLDCRASLFAGSGDADLIGLHNKTRRAIQRKRKSQPGSGEPEVWRETFEKYQITHVMPRLSGPNPSPDYITFGDLLLSKDWALTDLTASTAVFYRSGQSGEMGDYVTRHRLAYVPRAFQSQQPEAKAPDTSRVSARAETLTDGLFSVRQPRHPYGVQLANHFLQLAAGNIEATPKERIACAMLAVREATAGLRDDTNCADGYRDLGLAYILLDRLETSAMNEAGLNWSNPVRYIQAVAALQQAALLRPDDEQIQFDLLGLFERSQRGELAMKAIKRFVDLHPVTAESPKDEIDRHQQLMNVEFTLEEVIAKIESQVEQQLQNGADRFQVAAAAYQRGAVHVAIKVLEDDPIYKEQNVMARTALGSWLIEAGRVQEGIEALEQSTVSGGAPGWRNSLATSLLINAEYARAIELWQDQVKETNTNSTQAALFTMPFVTLNPAWISPDQYPLTQTVAAIEIMGNVRAENASLTYQIAQAQLEQGDLAGAARSLQYILDNAPDSHLRPLIVLYLEMLSGKKIETPAKEPLPTEDLPPLDEPPAGGDSRG
jgi:tetratricopeptide (TPR) repeat protein